MSNIYIQEPPSNGKVLLITSAGDIDVELWSKEAPKACRNFVQLCMEGYYDGTVFHRVVKDFIVQGGDPSGTGEGGQSIYGAPFKDEFHSRLRFVRRGLVGMANAGKNDNGSQFFFTMGPTQELQNKHTLFGKVTGNTVYNMLKLQDVEVDENERPSAPHKIKSTHILSNPYDDIVPRTKKKEQKEGEKKVKSKSKATKNFKLLSFGEEAEEDEEEVVIATKDMKGKSKSSHDLIDDPSLSTVQVVDEGPSPKRAKQSTDEDDEKVSDEYDEKMKERVRQKLKQDTGTSKKSEKRETEDANKLSRSEELRQEAKRLRKELRGEKIKTETSEDTEKEKVPTNDVVAKYMAEKQKYSEARQNIKKGSDREAVTLALLSKFQSKLSSVKRLAGEYSDDNEDDNEDTDKPKEDADEDADGDLSWMRHKLHFEDRSKKVIDANINDEDRYEIYDPRNPLTKRRRETSKQALKEMKEKR